MKLPRYMIIILLLTVSCIYTPPVLATQPNPVNVVDISQYQLPLPGPEIPGGIHNTSYSAQLVDGTVIQPGEVFSFNKTVGPRTLERGFVWSESIGWTSRGYARIKDVGGGVCRTSTAIHQAALRAGVAVMERHNHSIPVEYATPGDDAAVWYGSWDYKFKNNKPNPIIINTDSVDNQLVVTLKELSPVMLLVEGEQVPLNAAPFIEKGVTMIPVRPVLNALAAELHWGQHNQTLAVSYRGRLIELDNGSVLIKNDMMFMPCRALAALLACDLEWDSTNRIVNFKHQMQDFNIEDGENAQSNG
ncbi:VanW family protein [Peptococcaceae bacterium 1198_IL3148]